MFCFSSLCVCVSLPGIMSSLQILPHPPVLHALGPATEALPGLRKCALAPTQTFFRAPQHEMSAKCFCFVLISGLKLVSNSVRFLSRNERTQACGGRLPQVEPDPVIPEGRLTASRKAALLRAPAAVPTRLPGRPRGSTGQRRTQPGLRLSLAPHHSASLLS